MFDNESIYTNITKRKNVWIILGDNNITEPRGIYYTNVNDRR